MDWAVEGSEFESRQEQNISPLYVVENGSGAHRTSCSEDASLNSVSWMSASFAASNNILSTEVLWIQQNILYQYRKESNLI
jgi:hypothetical protein